MLERRLLPVLLPTIFRRHECVRDYLATLHRRCCSVAHIWDQGEAAAVFVERLVRTWPTSGRKSEHDILEVIDIDVWTAEDQAMDGVAGFTGEYQIPDRFAEVFWAGLHVPQLGDVDFERYPCDLRLEGCKCICDW